MSLTSCAQSVKEQNAIEEVEFCTGFDVLNRNSLLCQESFVDIRQDFHILPEGIATTPQSYQDESGSELPDPTEPADKMLPSFVPLVFSECVEKLDLHAPDYSRRNSLTQQDVLPSHFIDIAPEDNDWPY
ncbi:hypothetical protein N7476_000304 [Penicillium atrosanguineum]|uniref:Uncharacterized protein n=1 Tax=Penicillium atrosanguineum TaxID=1132637 RepID=A0A9W9QB87_9EURO|nr:hypothetical protein N7476_000304 [Penicillium atrosanguineum]